MKVNRVPFMNMKIFFNRVLGNPQHYFCSANPRSWIGNISVQKAHVQVLCCFPECTFKWFNIKSSIHIADWLENSWNELMSIPGFWASRFTQLCSSQNWHTIWYHFSLSIIICLYKDFVELTWLWKPNCLQEKLLLQICLCHCNFHLKLQKHRIKSLQLLN